ncbi:vacuolar protein sorting-associated protein 37A isoform X1 [Nematostella vectensis]|uniref:vacuolar protein sorting-associated protein 37A isoform X1 n=1 Tax=Nematostella vectensis TaxID=45351 RepID=UPI002076FD7E|nr:vacuolar protein sorting-associated protein 37A isoform X1 [Nematostella vectensis]
MSWMNLFGSSSPNPTSNELPAPTALQQQRSKQIETLRIFHHSVTEVQRDVEYRVTFTVGSSTLFLNVTLPPQFPQEKPVVKVSPPVIHPWVNDQMIVVGCQAINSFYMHSSLGKAVQEVVRELCDHPPQIVNKPSANPSSSLPGFQPISSNSFPGYQPLVTPFSSSQFGISNSTHGLFPSSSSSSSESQTASLITTSEVDSPSRKNTPAVAIESKEFPELNGLSLEELKNLNDSTDLLEEFQQNLESVKKLQEEQENLMLQNEEIARYNLSLQPKLEACKDAIIRNYELLNEKQQEFVKKNQVQKDLITAYSLANIHTNLEVAASQAELESDEIADEFLDGKLKVEDFISKFIDKRKTGHLRRAKEEKLRNVHTRF